MSYINTKLPPGPPNLCLSRFPLYFQWFFWSHCFLATFGTLVDRKWMLRMCCAYSPGRKPTCQWKIAGLVDDAVVQLNFIFTGVEFEHEKFCNAVVCAQAPAAKRKRIPSFFLTMRTPRPVFQSFAWLDYGPQSPFATCSRFRTRDFIATIRSTARANQYEKYEIMKICETHSATWCKIFAASSASIIHQSASAATSCHSGAAPFAFPGPAWYKDMRWGISGKKKSQNCRQTLPHNTLCGGIPGGCTTRKSFEGFAARFLMISLLDLNDGRPVLEGFQLELRKRHLTKAAEGRRQLGHTQFEPNVTARKGCCTSGLVVPLLQDRWLVSYLDPATSLHTPQHARKWSRAMGRGIKKLCANENFVWRHFSADCCGHPVSGMLDTVLGREVGKKKTPAIRLVDSNHTLGDLAWKNYGSSWFRAGLVLHLCTTNIGLNEFLQYVAGLGFR